jgi:hypothetical protein
MMPVNQKYTAQEWQEVYAAQEPSPEYYPNFNKGMEPQPGKNCLMYGYLSRVHEEILLFI